MTVAGARKTTDSSEAASRAYSLVASPPQPFGRYTLIGKLGHGGMAEVNLAVADGKAGFRKLVVIKRLHAHLAMEPGFIDMFLDEARLAARLNHPHCVQTYEVGEWEGSHFLAMEYLDGQGLERLLRMANQHERSIPPELAARIVGDALDGLAYAHELTDFDGTPLGVVHRDVSPQNIFVTYNGMVKLLDFGIAKASTHVVETKTGVIKGKYAYIAPEQALGGDVDQRSDLWSMGVVLWEVLTGRRLFKSVNELATLHETIQGEIKLPSAFRDELPTDLDTICMRALQREPDERYQTAQEMKEDIDRYLLSLDRAPGRKSIARLMDEHFAEVVATHKQTLHRCLEGTGSAVSRSTIERLVEPSPGGMNTPSVSGVRASDGPTPSPSWTPTPTPSPGVTPTPTPAPLGWNGSGGAPISADAASPPPAQAQGHRRGGWLWKVGLVVLAVLLAGVAALLLPLGDDAAAPDPVDVVASSRTTLPQRGEFASPADPPVVAPSRAGAEDDAPDVALEPIDMGGADAPVDLGDPGPAEPADVDRADPESAESSQAASEVESEGASEGRPARLAAARRARLRELRRQREAEREAQAAPEPDPRPAPEEARPAAAGPGYLTLATTPWTRVTVNGRDLGTTPLIRAELPAGAHVLHLENPEQGIRETYRVTIRAGETVSRRLGLR